MAVESSMMANRLGVTWLYVEGLASEKRTFRHP